jgi:glycosyltransferase involved in cell wall biosynthesis
MKIAIIFPKDSESLFDSASSKTFGGASVQMLGIANELSLYLEHNIYCLISSVNNKNTENVKKLNLVEVFSNDDNYFKKILNFNKSIKKIKPAAIIQHGLTFFSVLLSIYSKLLGIKFVFMFAHDREVNGIYQTSGRRCYIFRLLLKFSYSLITQNEFQKNTLWSKYKKNSELIYNGFLIPKKLDLESIEGREDILWVARCDKVKRPELFIKLAQNNPNKKFVMICPETEVNLFNKVKNLASKVDNLQFLDFVPLSEINDYFKKAKLFINTSTEEGFPQTFIQSAMWGVPIISLKVDPDYIISKNKLGIVCEDNLKIVEESLDYLFNQKIIYNNFSNNIYNYAEKNHNIKNTVNKILESLS